VKLNAVDGTVAWGAQVGADNPNTAGKGPFKMSASPTGNTLALANQLFAENATFFGPGHVPIDITLDQTRGGYVVLLDARTGLALGADAALKASAARYVRLPTALELFGDRGVVVGNPALTAETGWSSELGVVLAPARSLGAFDHLSLELVGFATRSYATIALVPTAALVVAPHNLGDARTFGGELSAAARLGGALSAVVAYTAMATRQSDGPPSYQGKALPHRPRHQLHGRVELAGRALERDLALWSDLELTAGSYLDPANLDRVPRRARVGLGARAEAVRGLLFGVEVDNLFDERIESVELDPPPRPDLARVPRAVADFYGYPLPGRAFYLTVQWET
jgi:iron complex outermembrane receptor protein